MGMCRRLSPTGGCCSSRSSDAIKRFEIRGDLGGIRIEKPFDCDLEGFLSRTIAGNAECQDLDFADLAEAGFVFAELDVCFADGFLDSVLSADFVVGFAADFAAGFAAVLALAFGEDFAEDFPAGFAVVCSEDLDRPVGPIRSNCKASIKERRTSKGKVGAVICRASPNDRCIAGDPRRVPDARG